MSPIISILIFDLGGRLPAGATPFNALGNDLILSAFIIHINGPVDFA